MAKNLKSRVDTVVRIRKDIHQRIKSSMQPKESFSDALERLVDAANTLSSSSIVYATKLYSDVADARGAAILEAVRTKTIPEMPHAVVVISEDNLDE